MYVYGMYLNCILHVYNVYILIILLILSNWETVKLCTIDVPSPDPCKVAEIYQQNAISLLQYLVRQYGLVFFSFFWHFSMKAISILLVIKFLACKVQFDL